MFAPIIKKVITIILGGYEAQTIDGIRHIKILKIARRAKKRDAPSSFSVSSKGILSLGASV